MGIDKDKLPVSALKKEAIQDALEVLKDIAKGIAEVDELRKLGMRADIVEFTRIMEHLAKLSSTYFELVPMAEQKDQVIKPITN